MIAQTIQHITAPAMQAFYHALRHPQDSQMQILKQILHDNCHTAFGKQYDFANIDNPETFAQTVPIRDYDAFANVIEQTAQGVPHLLTSEAVYQFEITGGSTAGAKFIPYTPSLLQAFQRGIHAWLGDLATRRPQAFSGSLYFVISPATQMASHTAGGIPIGLGNDLAYLGAELASVLQAQTLFQPELMAQQSATEWQIRTATLLAQHDNLSLISAWSPTLVLQLLSCLQREQDRILPQIVDKHRRQIVQNALSGSEINTPLLWRHLDTVSCWDSHTATAPADKLRELLPHAFVQGKGLLATEGISTLPFSGCLLPALTSHYYEFIDENHRLTPLTELQNGQRYRLILSTQGGLYRYDTQDWLLASASPYPHVPALHFVGRGSLHSDLCGEKLSEAFVAKALASVVKHFPGSLFLQGVQQPTPHYVLLIDVEKTLPNNILKDLDKALSANPQYAYARHIQQLGDIQICQIPHLTEYAARFAKSRLFGLQKLPILLPAVAKIGGFDEN